MTILLQISLFLVILVTKSISFQYSNNIHKFRLDFSLKALYSRQNLIKSITAVSFLSPLLVPSISRAASLERSYTNPEGHYSLSYPNDFVESPKLVKTHKYETFLKSESFKGFTVGVSVDPVKIDSVEQFTTPEKLGQRVIAVEKGKEGFIDGNMISTTATSIPLPSKKDGAIPAYDLEYQIESTRGRNHYNVRAAIYNKLLYVLTIQSKEDNYRNLSSIIHEILLSLRFI